MKRNDLLRHLFRGGCLLLREGARHSVIFHPITRRISTVPRHNEIEKFLAKKICRDLGINEPQSKL